jgi:hypothetical protein
MVVVLNQPMASESSWATSEVKNHYNLTDLFVCIKDAARFVIPERFNHNGIAVIMRVGNKDIIVSTAWNIRKTPSLISVVFSIRHSRQNDCSDAAPRCRRLLGWKGIIQVGSWYIIVFHTGWAKILSILIKVSFGCSNRMWRIAL